MYGVAGTSPWRRCSRSTGLDRVDELVEDDGAARVLVEAADEGEDLRLGDVVPPAPAEMNSEKSSLTSVPSFTMPKKASSFDMAASFLRRELLVDVWEHLGLRLVPGLQTPLHVLLELETRICSTFPHHLAGDALEELVVGLGGLVASGAATSGFGSSWAVRAAGRGGGRGRGGLRRGGDPWRVSVPGAGVLGGSRGVSHPSTDGRRKVAPGIMGGWAPDPAKS